MQPLPLPVPSRRQRGFSLIEVAVALMILGLALGATLKALGPQLAVRQYANTQRLLKDSAEAAVAFAMVNRRLPCPASATSGGRESFCTNATGACGAEVFDPASSAGRLRGRCFAPVNAAFVPGVTMGLGGLAPDGRVLDDWGSPLRYSVSDAPNTTANNSALTHACSVASPCYPYTYADGLRNAYYDAGVSTGTPNGNRYICRSATGTTGIDCGTATEVTRPAFLVYSYGANHNAGAIGADEAQNTNATPVFVLHETSDSGATNGAFDDLFEWVGAPQLVYKMQGNGVLP